MADIIFRYEEMESTANKLVEIADQYKSAADTLKDNFANATSAWAGDSKDKMLSFMEGPVYDYTGVTVPKLINALAELLKANAAQMKSADEQIAQSIPNSL